MRVRHEVRVGMPDSRALGYFVEAVAIGAGLADGFGVRDLAFVPAAWQIVDGAVSTFGWVCLLHAGRRAYLQYRVDEDRGTDPENVVVRTLGPGEKLPATDDPAVHWFEPRHVNQALALFQAAAGDHGLQPKPPVSGTPKQLTARYRARARQLREAAETANAAISLSLLRDADLLECLADLVDSHRPSAED